MILTNKKNKFLECVQCKKMYETDPWDKYQTCGIKCTEYRIAEILRSQLFPKDAFNKGKNG